MVSNDQGKVRVSGNLPQVIAESCQLITSVFTQCYKSISAEDRDEIRGDLFRALSTVIADILMDMKETDGESLNQFGIDDVYTSDETDMTDLLRSILNSKEE